ncbi:hypothetical protein SALBM311S_00748 [Streptomyces alboniger]
MPEMKVSCATSPIFAATASGVFGATGATPTWTASAAWSSWAGGAAEGPRPSSREVAVDLGGHHGTEDGRTEAAARHLVNAIPSRSPSVSFQ